MGLMGKSGKMFSFAFNHARKARFQSVLNDPEKKARVIRYGVASIILSTISILLSLAVFFIGNSLIYGGLTTADASTKFFLWFLWIILVMLVPTTWGYGLNDGGWQCKLDKKTTGKIGVILSIIAIVTYVGSLILVLTVK